ncbi:MAG: prolyl oligopeptidase family serine peptidase [Gemmataceae bacterium]
MGRSWSPVGSSSAPSCGPAPPPGRRSARQGAARPDAAALQALAESLRFAEESLASRSTRRCCSAAWPTSPRWTRSATPARRRASSRTPPPRGQQPGHPYRLHLPAEEAPRKASSRSSSWSGRVHGTFNSGNVNVLRELLAQGYAVLAPDYRGSSGPARKFWELIDYGGLEVEDVFAGQQWMLEQHDDIDPRRVGIMGWSAGELITLMNLFAHPKEFQVGYAGIAGLRPGRPDGLQVAGLPRAVLRPPTTSARRRRRTSTSTAAARPPGTPRSSNPLLIHTTTNDEDVNVLEVRHLIKALEGGGQAVRAQGLQGRPRRPRLQPPRHEAGAGVAGRGHRFSPGT